VAQVTPVKKTLSTRLGTWKAEQDERDRQEARRQQEVADAAARAGQEAKAATLERVAQVEPDPKLAESFKKEAEMVRSVDVHAAPVEVQKTAPTIVGGYTRATWKCEFVNLKELLQAYVEGRCFLDEEAINLTKYERSFQGVSRFLSVVDSLTTEIMNLITVA
jgi:hypothetical protein